MNVSIEKSTARGEISAPPSKSYAHRYIIGAALARGESEIENVCLSEDIRATIDCARTLGASVVFDEATEKPQTIRIAGIAGKAKSGGEFFCRESGSTLRFFLPLALSCRCNSEKNASTPAIFRGSPRLIERGISVYEEAFKNSVQFEKRIADGNGEVSVCGKILPGKYALRGNVSSQFFTGLLFALPLLNGDSELEILPPAESAGYIDLTLETLKIFGVKVEKTAKNAWFIAGNQHFRAGKFRVEGDYSNAAFLYAFNALGGDVKISGLNENSLQGDKVCTQLLKRLTESFTEADLSDCPDLAPVLFAIAAAKHGALFSGTRRLKIKESDRAEAMREELEKFGAIVKIAENEVKIIPPPDGLQTPEFPLSSHGDHRIAMAVSVLFSLTGGTISDAEAVKKSYPDFFEDLSSLGIKVRKTDEKR